MGAYLVDNPPRRSQYRTRRGAPSGVVVNHSAENTPDFVAFDGGAEAVAKFIQGRKDPGSYHKLADSDSRLQLVPWDLAAFHDGTGTNDHSVGLSAATRADVWPLAPAAWRDNCVANMAASAAEFSRWLQANHGRSVPARRVSAAQARDRVPGFVSHAELDPTRRSDPGKHFPWALFFAYYRGQPRPIDPELEDPDMQPHIKRIPDKGLDLLVFPTGCVWENPTPAERSAFLAVLDVPPARKDNVANQAEVDIYQALYRKAHRV